MSLRVLLATCFGEENEAGFLTGKGEMQSRGFAEALVSRHILRGNVLVTYSTLGRDPKRFIASRQTAEIVAGTIRTTGANNVDIERLRSFPHNQSPAVASYLWERAREGKYESVVLISSMERAFTLAHEVAHDQGIVIPPGKLSSGHGIVIIPESDFAQWLHAMAVQPL